MDECLSLPPGRKISLRASALPGSSRSEPQMQFELSDNGPGLPQAALRSVFDPFFVRIDDPQEFGINLMICYFWVYHHGGTIKVKSDESEGTTFTMTFPLNPQIQTSTRTDKDFLPKTLLNKTLWEKLLSGRP